MNIYNAMELLNKGKKVYNTHWNDPKIRYIWLSTGEQQEFLLDNDNHKVSTADLLYTEGWEEYILLTAEEKAIIKAFIAIDYNDVEYVQFVIERTGYADYGDVSYKIRLYRNYDEENDAAGVYKIRNEKLFKNLDPFKFYRISDLALDEKEDDL